VRKWSIMQNWIWSLKTRVERMSDIHEVRTYTLQATVRPTEQEKFSEQRVKGISYG
jgi:hypothetical protein